MVLTSEIRGRDENKEDIIKLLFQSNNEEHLSIIATVGIGEGECLGKTTPLFNWYTMIRK